MINKGDAHDPKGLIYEAYRIDGISKAECRTIFLDWALSLPLDHDTKPEIETLLLRYGPDNPAHPMTDVMTEGLAAMDTPRRRGGWRSRKRD